MVDTNTAIKTIPPTVLGKFKKAYDKLTPEEITVRKAQDVKLLGISLEDLDAQLAKLEKETTAGKRDKDAAQRDIVEAALNGVVGFLNLAHTKRAGFKPEDCVAFVAQLGDAVDAYCVASYYGKGFVGMIDTQRIDLATINDTTPKIVNPEMLLAVHNSGWDDGSKKRRNQYSARQIPSSKSSGYRKDFGFPVAVLTPVAEPVTPPEEPKKKVKGSK